MGLRGVVLEYYDLMEEYHIPSRGYELSRVDVLQYKGMDSELADKYNTMLLATLVR